MMNHEFFSSLKKGVAMLSVLLIAFSATAGTGAWFLDYEQWVDSRYQLGMIDYEITVNDNNIEILKEGQGVPIAIPIIGGVKMDETGDREDRFTTKNFNEGVTVVRLKIQNTGDFPVTMDLDLNFKSGLADNGILYMILPTTAAVDYEKQEVTVGGDTLGYKEYIIQEARRYTAGWQPAGNTDDPALNYSRQKDAVLRYFSNEGNHITTHELPCDQPEIYTIHVLFWAEYDIWLSDRSQHRMLNGIRTVSDQVEMLFKATPPEE